MRDLSRSTSTPVENQCIKYKVSECDTLAGIAARNDCLPTEIMKLNRLSSRQVFSGQVLLVPDRAGHEDLSTANTTAIGTCDPLPGCTGSSQPLAIRRRSERDHRDRVTSDDFSSGGSVDTGACPGNGAAAAGTGYAAAAAAAAGIASDSCYVASSSVTAALKPPGAYLKDGDGHMKYVKISSRHITDGQGVVFGTLLVTPNCVMFDPNVSDPLVLEHGVDRYGVIVPMDNVVAAAIYRDIAHMRVKDRGSIPLPEMPPPEIYYPGGGLPEAEPGVVTLGGESHPSQPATTTTTTAAVSATTSDSATASASASSAAVADTTQCATLSAPCSAADADSCDEEERKSGVGEAGATTAPLDVDSEATVQCTPQSTTHSSPPPPTATTTAASVSGSAAGHSSDTVAAGTTAGSCPSAQSHSSLMRSSSAAAGAGYSSAAAAAADTRYAKEETTKQKVWKRFSHPLTWMETLSGSQERDPAPLSAGSTASSEASASSKSVLSNMVSSVSSVSNALVRRSSSQRRTRNTSGFAGYRNLVTMDEKESLFSSLDRLMLPYQCAAQSQAPSDDSPLYLCLSMGRRVGRRVKKSVRILTYGERRLRSELWFSVPLEKCDLLYNFFQYWTPHIYGSLDTVRPGDRGFELVDSDTEIWEDEEAMLDSWSVLDSSRLSGEDGTPLIELPKQLPRQSWNCSPSMSEELRRALHSTSLSSLDVNYVPELVGNSDILTDQCCQALARKMPARVEGYPWNLLFSSSQDGFSLKSLYRKCMNYESPMLLLVQDTENYVFGVVTSNAVRLSEHYYGTGETFLFTLQPQFAVYKWSGQNNYYIRGTSDGLEFGSGDGHYGLFLDSDLYRGCTQSCQTFHNQPLTPRQDFTIKTVELWALT